jgi:hypothetical protein
MLIHSKATNSAAAKCYEDAGYRPHETAFSKIIK